MVKTQIQLPDALYRDLKRVAAAQEWSLAETLRRGAEQLLQQYPALHRDAPPASASAPSWTPPTSTACGWQGLSADQLQEALWADSAPRLPSA